MYQKELDQIVKATESFGEAVFGLVDMVHWQDDALDHFVEKEILKRTKPASEVECDGCEEKCVEKVVFVDGKKPSDTRAYIVCRMRDDMRPIAVDVERLKRWKANKDKLIELGYCKKPEKPAVTPPAVATIAANQNDNEKVPPPIDTEGLWTRKDGSLSKLREIDSNDKRDGIKGNKQTLKRLKEYLKRSRKRKDIAETLYPEDGRIKTTMPHRSMFKQK